jgi:hypothetical protein
MDQLTLFLRELRHRRDRNKEALQKMQSDAHSKNRDPLVRIVIPFDD